MLAIALGLGWTVGVYLGLVGNPGSLVALGVGAFGLTAAVLLPHRAGAVTVGLAIIALAAGLWRGQLSPGFEAAQALAAHNGETVLLRGVATTDPDPRGRWAYLLLSVEQFSPQLEAGGDWQPAGGTVQVQVNSIDDWRAGDRLELTGRLEEPPQSDGFSYREYLARQGVFSVVRYPKVTLLAREQRGWLATQIDRLRWAASDILARSVAEPAGGLAQGVILGRRGL